MLIHTFRNLKTDRKNTAMTLFNRRFALLCMFVLAALAFGADVYAHDEKDPRHIAMTTLGKNMKAIKKGLKAGEITTAMQQQGGEIAAIALKLVALFPKGHEKEDSRAKPEIWTDMAGFKKANDKMIVAARALNEALAAKNVQAAQAMQKNAGKTCGGCHKAYRLPKK
jgi:cytochrome c556